MKPWPLTSKQARELVDRSWPAAYTLFWDMFRRGEFKTARNLAEHDLFDIDKQGKHYGTQACEIAGTYTAHLGYLPTLDRENEDLLWNFLDMGMTHPENLKFHGQREFLSHHMNWAIKNNRPDMLTAITNYCRPRENKGDVGLAVKSIMNEIVRNGNHVMLEAMTSGGPLKAISSIGLEAINQVIANDGRQVFDTLVKAGWMPSRGRDNRRKNIEYEEGITADILLHKIIEHRSEQCLEIAFRQPQSDYVVAICLSRAINSDFAPYIEAAIKASPHFANLVRANCPKSMKGVPSDVSSSISFYVRSIGAQKATQCLQALIKHGLDPDEVRTEDGDTLLMDAVYHGNLEMVKVILAAGGSVLQPAPGLTEPYADAVQYAERLQAPNSASPEMMAILRAAKAREQLQLTFGQHRKPEGVCNPA